MRGNSHVRFLGGKGGAIRLTQPASAAERSNFDLLIFSPLWVKPRQPEAAFIVVFRYAQFLFLKTLKNGLRACSKSSNKKSN
jgi:hypothetical protein